MVDRKVRLLSSMNIRQVCSMKEAIEAVRKAFILASEGKVKVPARTRLDVLEAKGTSLIMPSYLPEDGKLGVKIINLYENNPRKGLPFSHALMLVFEAADGRPLGILEASTLTALRTGAACGLATDLLSRPESRRLTLFGAGFQARFQLEAVVAVRKIEEARIYDQDKERATLFARKMSESLSMPIRVAGSAQEALEGADIISTATTSKIPVFDDRDIKPGVHINAIGSYKPEEREIPSLTVARARVFVDKKDMALEEAGDLIIPMKEGLFGPEHIVAELGEVALGKKPGRLAADEITFFKTVGIAAQDIVLASVILPKAMEMNLGYSYDFYEG